MVKYLEKILNILNILDILTNLLFFKGTYVLVDIVLNILPPMVFGTTEAYPYLVKQLPTRSIISFLPQFSMYSFIILQILLYLFIKYVVSIQVW